MTLRELTKPQFDAAIRAADTLRKGDSETARASFRAARDLLIDRLPVGTDERPLISQACHWLAMNDFADALCSIPSVERMPA